MISEFDFIQKNRAGWERLDLLFKKRKKSFNEAEEFGNLYLKTTEDLSFSQTHFSNSNLNQYLNNLIYKCHFIFYKKKKSNLLRLINFFGKELPKIFYSLKYPILLSFMIFILSSSIAFLLVRNNVELAEIFVDSHTYEMILTDLETRDQFSNFDNIPKEYRIPISFYIWFNNSKVALYAFVLGITFGLGTIFILIMNGLMLGTLMSIYFMNGHFTDFISLILVHGSIELTAIFISGGAGFFLSSAILVPKREKRIEKLKINALIAFKCITGVIVLLLWAGLIEGLVTTLKLNVSIRFIIAAVNIVIIILYFIPGFFIMKKDMNLQPGS
ncbi:MAG: stage II sporulation protein M [Spirochaetes bacterium]|nr:stage II sporulation protein M [Spirochaetota bacterium]